MHRYVNDPKAMPWHVCCDFYLKIHYVKVFKKVTGQSRENYA